jgi:hypothetical protein
MKTTRESLDAWYERTFQQQRERPGLDDDEDDQPVTFPLRCPKPPPTPEEVSRATILLRIPEAILRWKPSERAYDPLNKDEQDRADIADEHQAQVDEGRKAIAVEQAMDKWAVRLRRLGLGYQDADDRLQRYGLTLEQLAGVCPGCEVCRSMGLGPN